MKRLRNQDEVDRLNRFIRLFGDPKKRRKIQAQKTQEEEEFKEDVLYLGKQFSKDVKYVWSDKWAPYIKPIQKRDWKLSDIPNSTHLPGLNGLTHYMEFCVTMKTFIQESLLLSGWTQNLTGYDPLAGAHSVPELRQTVLEMLKMAVKQRLTHPDE